MIKENKHFSKRKRTNLSEETHHPMEVPNSHGVTHFIDLYYYSETKKRGKACRRSFCRGTGWSRGALRLAAVCLWSANKNGIKQTELLRGNLEKQNVNLCQIYSSRQIRALTIDRWFEISCTCESDFWIRGNEFRVI